MASQNISLNKFNEFVNKVIKESSFKIKYLTEAISTVHSIERFENRFLIPEELTVGYFDDTLNEFLNVGTFSIPNNLKETIRKKNNAVRSVNFPMNKSYAIKIADINIDKNEVNYYSKAAMQDAMKTKEKFVFLDNNTKTYGDVIYLVVRENKIVTEFFAISDFLSHVNKNSFFKVGEVIDNFTDIYNLEVKKPMNIIKKNVPR